MIFRLPNGLKLMGNCECYLRALNCLGHTSLGSPIPIPYGLFIFFYIGDFF